MEGFQTVLKNQQKNNNKKTEGETDHTLLTTAKH